MRELDFPSLYSHFIQTNTLKTYIKKEIKLHNISYNNIDDIDSNSINKQHFEIKISANKYSL